MTESTRHRRRNKYVIIFGIVFLTVISLLIAVVLRYGTGKGKDKSGSLNGPGWESPSHLRRFSKAAVSCDNAECAEVGMGILKAGGHAVDSAIATLLCNGVQNAHSMGIGGGFFMTIYDRKNGKAETLTAREVAPKRSSKDMFVNNTAASSKGGLAVGVPGEILGYKEAHDKYGKLPWDSLFTPTIDMCRKGFKISKTLGSTIEKKWAVIGKSESFRKRYANSHGHKKEGELSKCENLAKTLEIISADSSAFYKGDLAKIIAEEVQQTGGIITEEDLRDYKVKWKPPLNVSLGPNHNLLTVPPPASGVVLAYILNIIAGYNFTSQDMFRERDLVFHRLVESFKFSYAKRSALGDDAFVNVTELVANMTSDEFAEATRRRITDGETHDYTYYEPTFSLKSDSGTSHLSIVSEDGDAVSVTSTINTHFGSKVMGNITGIIYNNQMDDFSTPGLTNYYGVPPSKSNFIEPGKRPMSSICPTIVVDKEGNVRLVVGASGGTRITTSTAWVAAAILNLGMDPKKAIDYPRVHHQLMPDTVFLETRFSEEVAEGLRKRKHDVKMGQSAKCVVQAIYIDEKGEILANADYRKGGDAAGI